MSTLKDRAANTSLYFFEPAELAPDTLRVVRFEGTEGISQPFNFELQLISEDPDLDFEKVVNKSATFTMMRGDEPRPVSGIVTDFSVRGRTADYVVYQATLRPRLHWLSLSYRSRIFQEKKVEDILRTVLEEDGLSSSDFKFKLQESYSPREYCVQYEETDLNFASRLMEFEGMYYFFEHGDGQDTLVVTDKKSEHEKIPDPVSLQFHQGAGGMVKAKQETVSQFVCEEQVVTGKVELKDYNYRTPETMTAESEMNSEMPGKRYEYGEHFRDTGRGNRLAKVRNEEIEAQRKVLDGESDSLGLRSGFLFTLEKHYRKSLNADYLITQVEHQGSQRHGMDIGTIRSSEDKEESEPTYQNRITCIPATVQYRAPRKTPKPEVSGVMTAEVDGSGDYAYLDDQGRYRAKMHFDQRDKSPGTATLPIRMKQPYSGKGEAGFHKPSHPGTEMIFACENGDPDRPMALGTAPNPNNESPVDNENSSQHIFQTTSDNEFVIEDQGGQERIELHTPYGKSTLQMGKSGRLIEGIGLSTQETAEIHAEKGIVMKVGDGFTPDPSTLEKGVETKKMVLDTISAGVGETLEPDKLRKTAKKLKSVYEGVESALTDWKKGMEKPNMYLSAEGGIGVTTNKSMTVYTQEDIGLFADESVYVVAEGGGLTFGAARGGADTYVGTGGIALRSVKDDVIARSEMSGVKVVAGNVGDPEGVGEQAVKLEAKKDVSGVSENGDVSLIAESGNVKIEAEKSSVSVDAQENITIDAGKEIKLKCGQSSITLKKSGNIEIKGKSIKIDGKRSVKIEAMELTSKANGSTLKGTQINLDGEFVMLKGSLNKIG
jgi:type VI secretion system secreted protein VgrG